MTDAINTNEVAAVEAEAAKVELTTEQKIAQLEGRIAKLRQTLLTESLLNNIEKGDKVTIKFGRADKVRHIEGEVAAVALPNIAVVGPDLETFKVHVRDVIANPSAEARTGVANVGEINPVDGRRPDEAGASDPVEDMIAEGSPVVADDAAADPLENA